MTTRLDIYNGALQLCGERKLATITENREPRHQLDTVWDDGGVAACLSEGQWKFAMRSSKFTFDPAIEPAWGYQRAFTKPDDWVVTSAVAIDEFFNTPLLRYNDEVGFWYADVDDIYVRYVSDDAQFGLNLGEWPSTFAEYVKGFFAFRIVHSLTADKNRWAIVLDDMKRRKTTAKNKDAMADPTSFPAEGAWIQSRRGGRRRGPLGDGGTTGSLIG